MSPRSVQSILPRPPIRCSPRCFSSGTWSCRSWPPEKPTIPPRCLQSSTPRTFADWSEWSWVSGSSVVIASDHFDAVCAARPPACVDAVVAARVVNRGTTRTAARVADRDATRTAARVADRHDTSADTTSTFAPSAVPTPLPMSLTVTQPMLTPTFSQKPLSFVPSFAPTPLPPNAPTVYATVCAVTPAAICAGCSAVVCTVSSAVLVVDALGDTDAVATAAYSIAASADTSAAATAATTAAQSDICVEVRVTCRAESSFAACAVAPAADRAVAPAAVARVCRVECRPPAVTVARTRS